MFCLFTIEYPIFGQSISKTLHLQPTALILQCKSGTALASPHLSSDFGVQNASGNPQAIFFAMTAYCNNQTPPALHSCAPPLSGPPREYSCFVFRFSNLT